MSRPAPWYGRVPGGVPMRATFLVGLFLLVVPRSSLGQAYADGLAARERKDWMVCAKLLAASAEFPAWGSVSAGRLQGAAGCAAQAGNLDEAFRLLRQATEDGLLQSEKVSTDPFLAPLPPRTRAGTGRWPRHGEAEAAFRKTIRDPDLRIELLAMRDEDVAARIRIFGRPRRARRVRRVVGAVGTARGAAGAGAGRGEAVSRALARREGRGAGSVPPRPARRRGSAVPEALPGAPHLGLEGRGREGSVGRPASPIGSLWLMGASRSTGASSPASASQSRSRTPGTSTIDARRWGSLRSPSTERCSARIAERGRGRPRDGTGLRECVSGREHGKSRPSANIRRIK